MKIAVIGATGFVGSHIVKEALDRGFEVLALARKTSDIAEADNLTKENLDVSLVDTLASVLIDNKVDVVISAYNAGWTNPNIYNDFLEGSKNIEAAVVKSGIKRLIVIGGAGSLYIDGTQLVDGPDFPKDIIPGAKAARDYLNILKENKVLDWTFFSPAIEMHQGIAIGRTGHYRLGTDAPVFDNQNRCVLSVEDVAVAIIDEVEKPQFIKQRFTAAY